MICSRLNLRAIKLFLQYKILEKLVTLITMIIKITITTIITNYPTIFETSLNLSCVFKDECQRPDQLQLRASRVHGGDHWINQHELPSQNLVHASWNSLGTQIRTHDALQEGSQQISGNFLVFQPRNHLWVSGLNPATKKARKFVWTLGLIL